MTELSEAFTGFKFDTKTYQTFDYFFTQRNLKEELEYFDTNLNRKNKKVNIIYNFLALNIPQNIVLNDTNINTINNDCEIEVYGDAGYTYKGKISSYQGITPNLLIPLKSDKKIFVHITTNNKKEYTCFIEVPKRFQSTDDKSVTESKITSESDL
jgi:hypothetical protein